MIKQIKLSLFNLKQRKPLVLCLTNYVTMDLMANSLLALGAAPLMSESIEEIEELVCISHSIYINIGTLNDVFMERAIHAAQVAKSLNKPIILDPVGAGASQLRTSAALELLPIANVVRGNASEIIALSGASGSSKGVESSHPVEQAMAIGNNIARDLNKTVVISGPQDFITDGKNKQILPFGSDLMPLITGMGCSMTAVMGAFLSNNSNYFESATFATAFYGLCGQLAHQQTQEPGSFRQAFINNLFQPDWDFFTNAFNQAGIK